jgi:arylsulfatase A-like enzyme
MQHEESLNFAREEVRRTVIPTYMGLISQFDAHVGRIVAHLESTGEIANTIIIVTSDHGDYLGDHWLGEKDLFHEEIVRIPLVIVDPRPAADATRGAVLDDLVESIDLAPTFLEWAGGPAEPHRLEGRSIVPLLVQSRPDDWRDAVFCDGDFALRHARRRLGLGPNDARGLMVRTARWKYVDFGPLPPQLFDLESDPRELEDLGRTREHAAVRAQMKERLFAWLRARRTRVTVSDATIEALTGSAKRRGYRFGEW